METSVQYDEFQSLQSEFEQIQTCMGMYISYKGVKGVLHLIKEALNNSVDELTNPECKTEKKKINVSYDENTNQIMIFDNGRGIELSKLEDALTKKHTSTKYGRKYNKFSAGQNGVGLKLIAALSEYIFVTSYNGRESQTIEFKEGDINSMIVGDVKKSKKDQHGLLVIFKPNEKYFGDINIPNEMISDWIRRLMYIIHDDIKINYIANKKGTEIPINLTFTPKSLTDNVKYIIQDLEFPIIELYGEIDYPAKDNLTNNDDSNTERLELKMAFSYDKSSNSKLIESYCNYVYTIDDGKHVEACESAICRFFTKSANEDKESKYEVINEDCKSGLVLVVECRSTDPEFGGQTKEKIDSFNILKHGRKIMLKELEKYFSNNASLLKRIVNYLRKVSKARQEVNKIKGVQSKKESDFVTEASMQGYYPISDRHYNGYKELFIVEGKSAAGNFLKCRNQRVQAVLWIMGAIENIIGSTKINISTKSHLRELYRVLNLEFGAKFDPTRLRFNKIIIASDRDIDGHYITSILCSHLAIFLEDLIREGYVYKSIPPLYLISENDAKKAKIKKVIFDKKEYFNIFHGIISDNVDMVIEDRHKNVKELNKKEKMKWLDINKYYLDILLVLSKKKFCNPVIIEQVCYGLLITDNEISFKNYIEEIFSETTYNLDTKILSGSMEGQYVSLSIDKYLMKNMDNLTDIMLKNPSIYVGYRKKNSGEDEYKRVTIGDFLSVTKNKYLFDIQDRFKGLGEIDPLLMFQVVLNPLYRKIVRFTMDDVERAQKVMKELHGKGSETAEIRREMIDNYSQFITYDDIDN